MFSKEDAQRIKKEFWSTFSEEYPRKWLLYDTKIKDFSFKFHVDNKIAQVLISIEPKNNEHRIIYFEKIESLKSILIEEYVPNIVLDRNFQLENGKIVSKIWVELNNISLYNKDSWQEIYKFFNHNMNMFELFFYEYENYIKDLKANL